jgi:magnesium-transporting ATPase (P-type)
MMMVVMARVLEGVVVMVVTRMMAGRTLFDNLTKTIAYTLTHLVSELVAVIINIIWSVPAGASTLMILSIDLVTDVSPAYSQRHTEDRNDWIIRIMVKWNDPYHVAPWCSMSI